MNRFVRFLVLGAAVSLMAACINRPRQKETDYKPVSLFTPAYNALGQAIEEGDGEYNLDATIRIIRAFDMASVQTGNFEEYMDLLSQQDYRNVAPDVLEAQRKLFPVLQKMYKLQQENEKYDGIWMVVTSAETTLDDMGNDFLSDFDLKPGLLKLTGAVNSAFENFKKVKKIKDKGKADLDNLKDEYTATLRECWPVFLKYRESWEKLCIKKDRAYLDVYDGRDVSAYNLANEILEVMPEDRDALLIKAMALADMENFGPEEKLEAEQTLDKYIDLYPTRTAPSLMIKGIIAARSGEGEQAFAHFDHAAIEYPRQAAALKDMLDAYVNRPYFAKTHEGLYFRQMYKATLEGYGLFSPNFQKALYYERNGNREGATREIYDHFFRRGNQDVHDYLLSDMEFCEKHLQNVITSAFPESQSIGLSVVEKKPFMGKNHLDITLSNDSEVPLQNVRVFLCYHLVGMYPGDYSVEELPGVNSIPSKESYTWSSQAHTGDEIVYTRAIVLTDDRICWTDSPEYKERHEKSIDTSGVGRVLFPADGITDHS